ncbi:hypothetical protein ABW20_dc0102724 [Dactylellina cionopaga]|nr:hypothetical protein ABW20_dc0102724 [Dactylellina cionopaga]
MLPIYNSPYGDITDFLISQEIAEDIGTRLVAPPKKDEFESENLLGEEGEDYFKDFDVPWRSFEEEKKGTTPPRVRANSGRQTYRNPQLEQYYQPPSGSRSVGGSPQARMFNFADSDDEADTPDLRLINAIYGPDDNVGQNIAATYAQFFRPGFADGDFEYSDDEADMAESTWIIPPLSQINTDPQSAGLEHWQDRRYGGDASSEDKGI